MLFVNGVTARDFGRKAAGAWWDWEVLPPRLGETNSFENRQNSLKRSSYASKSCLFLKRTLVRQRLLLENV